MEKKEQLYEGKAKKVFATEDPDVVIVDYKDDATAFNGEKKGTIVGKGVINNRMTNYVFQVLEKEGVPTHYVEELSDRETAVKKVEIVPLEVIVRNVAAGSFSKRLGIEEGRKLLAPTLEFSYKDDDLGDPLINDYFAIAIGAATREEIDKITEYTFKVNDVLKKFFDEAGIDLIDFKIEFGRYHGDIILAEPGALIGFAGPRVIEQTIGQKLPEGFQRAEFILKHGFVDQIVKREEMRETLIKILKLHQKGEMAPASAVCQSEAGQLGKVHSRETFGDAGKTFGDKLRSAWDSVLLSRRSDRPVASDYIDALFEDFTEFHGDRYFKDDGAIIGGIASFHGLPVTVIGQEKGKNTKENIKCNFGMPSPDGYRKALRLMKQAETFGRPIICFVDTPGAFCGMDAEERGQGEAIARNLFEMSGLKVPILSIVIGEGGSGGALAMAVANEVWMLEHSIYSILSPEGFASILWKDSKRAGEAAGVMKITAKELKALGVIDRVITEEEPAGIDSMPQLKERLDKAIREFMDRWCSLDGEATAEARYTRFRKF